MRSAFLVFILLATLLSPLPATAADSDESGVTTYTVNIKDGTVTVESEIFMRNNTPPKTETYSCLKYRTEPYQSYESYQTYDYLYSIWHPGYWYWGNYYPGWSESVYGWRTHYRYVTRYRQVSYWDTCSKTTRYYDGSFEGSIPANATGVSASVNGSRSSVSFLRSSTAGGRAMRNIRVNSARLWYGQTRTIKLRYTLPAGKPRSASEVRINPAFFSFCGLGYGRTGGTVRVVIPMEYAVTSPTGWNQSKTLYGTQLEYKNSSNIYEILPCITGTNMVALTSRTVKAPSGKEIAIKAWPDDPTWLAEVEKYALRHVDALETLTGLPLSDTTGTIEIREVATTELGPFSGLYASDTGVISVSEQYDEETVVHELSHVWFNQNLPRWLAEGIAQWVSKRAIDGDMTAPFAALEDQNCYIFDPAPVFKKDKVRLSDFGVSSILKETPVKVIAAQYILSCGTAALFMDSFSDSERLRFLTAAAAAPKVSAFGSDVAVEDGSDFRNVADLVALSLDPEHSNEIDAWLTPIKDGALVGLDTDALLSAAGRQDALAAFNTLQARLRSIGWDGMDAPIGIRQALAQGEYSNISSLRALSEAVREPLTFFTREEIQKSAIRERVRNLSLGDAQGPAAIEQIRLSGVNLTNVGRDWAATANPFNLLGTVLLGNPDSLREDAIAALTSGDLQALVAASISAERAASLSGLTGILMSLLLTLAVVWVITRRRQGLSVVPLALAKIPHKGRAYPAQLQRNVRQAMRALRRSGAKVRKKLDRFR